MIDTAKLKEKILDLAIRGKLVPQDPNDEPASVLLEKIRAEKLQMVKDGKLKQKDIKDDTVIFVGDDNLHYEKFADGSVKCIEDEIPFEIPKSWAWCRFSTITINRDSERKPVALSNRNNVKKIYDYYGASGKIDKMDNYIFNEKLLLIGEDGANLITRSKPIAFFADGKYWVNNHAHCIDSTEKNILEYICLYINSIKLEKYVTGAAQPKMNQENMNNIFIPLPPFNEQINIFKKVRELNNIIDSFNNLNINLFESINSLKSKILDLAIRGKLAPQDPNDEPADVLLERIRKEKEELIKQGKIKRDKKESIIFKGDDNSYYGNLPNNWSLTTLKEITNDKELNDGDWIVSDNMVDSGPVKLIQLGSIGFMNYIEKGFKYLTHDTFERLNCSTIKENYLLINRIISDKMCCCMLPKINGTLITTVDTCWIAPNDNHYNIKYLMFALSSPLFQSEVNYKSSGTTRRRISKFNIINIQFPFPPILEQKKIVDDVEKLFKFIDNIASALK